jgi:hypothetical protein
MTSVERILEYTDLESEAVAETDVKPRKGWPDKGGIKFENMSFSYHKSMPKVLHNISCCIKPMEKVNRLFVRLDRENIIIIAKPYCLALLQASQTSYISYNLYRIFF